MEWQKGRESDNVVEDDENGEELGSGGSRFPFGGIHLGAGGIILVVILSLVAGINPIEVLTTLSGSQSNPPISVRQTASTVTQNNSQSAFVKSILGSTEDVWGRYFRESGREYQDPKLQLFHGHTRSACGVASESMGPFYCSGDQRVYLDLDFFDELKDKFHADGDFARAYVIAHEVGHHIQNSLGIMARVEREQSAGRAFEGAQGLSVRLELQADCFAGVWAKRAEDQLHWLQSGDIESAMNAAKQVGDDTIENRVQGYAVPDSFTHGTALQRMKWFKAGMNLGDIGSCDTFKGSL